MRYKDFIWPNNPTEYHWELKKKLVSHKIPGGGYVLEDLGQAERVLTGSGVFVGKKAYEHMKKLVEVYLQEEPGLLYHPVLELKRAYFEELELTEEPRENYVGYRFSFREESGDEAVKQTVSRDQRYIYTAAGGETIWDVAAVYKVTADSLMERNPHIYNPNFLTRGTEVLIW